MRGPVLRRGSGDLARGSDRLRKIVVDMGVDAGESELDPRDRHSVPRSEERPPASGISFARKRRTERRKVQPRKLNVEFRKPRRVGKSPGTDARFDSLRHLQVEPIEPLQSIAVGTRCLDNLHNSQDVRDRSWWCSDSSQKCRVIREHGSLII